MNANSSNLGIINNNELLTNQMNELGINDKYSYSGSFYAHFTDGYGFRALIEYCKLLHKTLCLRISSDGIKIVQPNMTGTIINEISLNAYELTEYRYDNPNPENKSQQLPEKIIVLNTASFREHTKAIGKKDQFIIYQQAGDNSILMQINTNNSNYGVTRFNPMMVEYIDEYELPKFNERDKNCAVGAQEFSKICNALTNTKNKTFKIQAYPKGFIFVDQMAGKTSVSAYPIGNPEPDHTRPINSAIPNLNITYHSSNPAQLRVKPKNELFELTVTLDTLKALSKIGTLANTGTIKLIANNSKELNGLLCIIAHIGHFGKLKVYIRNPTTN